MASIAAVVVLGETFMWFHGLVLVLVLVLALGGMWVAEHSSMKAAMKKVRKKADRTRLVFDHKLIAMAPFHALGSCHGW